MISDEDLHWPDNDPELMAKLVAAPDHLLHEWMCDCAEHAVAICEPLHFDAHYMMPETTPIEVKRLWLNGEVTDGDLERAQYRGAKECYYGNLVQLGAAILGTAWYPGSGIAVAEDEHYAESMTYYANAREALGDVMRECLKSVAETVHRAEYHAGDYSPGMVHQTSEAEKQWQKQHILAAVIEPEKHICLGATRKGEGRSENQDAAVALPDLGLFVVVDAMGSARAAKITSTIFEETIRLARSEGTLDGALTRAARQANAAIMQEAQADHSLRGMGAQFVALLVDKAEIRVAWIGQCRCYRSRDKKAELLTKDDPTLGCQGPYEAGMAEAELVVPFAHPVLGADLEVHVHELAVGAPRPGDTYLLSTDGVHGLHEDRVRVHFDNAWHETLPRLLSRLWDHVSSDDDATALCVRLGSS